MPTERFANLQEDKKKKIIQVAIEEFSKYAYEDVSINQIVKAAGISRGSFYTYFENKEDLHQYLFRDTFQECSEWVDRILDDGDKDIYDVAEEAVHQFLEYDVNHPNFQFFRNELANLKLLGGESRPGGSTVVWKKFLEFSSKCYKKTEKLRKKYVSEKEYACIAELLLVVVCKAAAMYFTSAADKTDILNMAEIQISAIRGTNLE